jgi:shikimate dehydrogenase
MKVFGIISDERALKSKSPVMHNTVFRNKGVAGVYVPFVIASDRVQQAVEGIRALGIAGVNVTVPYKETIMAYLDDISREAKAIGAVNTIVRRIDRLEGYNTDAGGFLDALERAGFDPAGKKALVFGHGGAAKAAAYALKQAGATELVLTGRREEPLQEAARGLSAEACLLKELTGSFMMVDLVVNATPVSSPTESSFLAELTTGLSFGGLRLVVDLNYGRTANFWQVMALKHGAEFMDGLAMLALQARRSFKLWTGDDANPEEFIDALVQST